jgi:hypothetical protein
MSSNIRAMIADVEVESLEAAIPFYREFGLGRRSKAIPLPRSGVGIGAAVSAVLRPAGKVRVTDGDRDRRLFGPPCSRP